MNPGLLRTIPASTATRPGTRLQLDLFVHNREVVLRNAATEALFKRDGQAAREALAALAAEYPDDRLLRPMRVLLEAMRPPVERLASHEQAAHALRALDTEIVPSAAEVFEADRAQAWLAPLWFALARAAQDLPYDPRFPDTHAAALLLRGGDGPAAAESIAAIPSWQRIPAPLAWMARARFAAGGLESAWGLMAELAWIDAPRLGTLARRLASPQLDRLLQDFDAGFQPEDEGELAWFPAWALVVEPGLALAFRGAQPGEHAGPERAARLVASLLALERQGRHAEMVERRKHLRELQPKLFARYMATR